MSERQLSYKGYKGSIEVDFDDDLLFGRILFITDCILYTAKTVPEIRVAFSEAVDEYLALCARSGKQPNKSASGSFNVRTTPKIHKDAQLRAATDDTSLNEVINKALVVYLYAPRAAVQGTEFAGLPPFRGSSKFERFLLTQFEPRNFKSVIWAMGNVQRFPVMPATTESFVSVPLLPVH